MSTIMEMAMDMISEGKLGPDHPESRNMKSAKDFKDKKREEDVKSMDKGNRKYKNVNGADQRKEDEVEGKKVQVKHLAAAQKNKYRNDGQSRYIEGSDKDKNADQRIKNAVRGGRSDSATIGSAYRRSSEGRKEARDAKKNKTVKEMALEMLNVGV